MTINWARLPDAFLALFCIAILMAFLWLIASLLERR